MLCNIMRSFAMTSCREINLFMKSLNLNNKSIQRVLHFEFFVSAKVLHHLEIVYNINFVQYSNDLDKPNHDI